MFDPQPYLDKLAGLRAFAERHNTRPDYIRAGYEAIATYCATIRYDDRPPYVALFNAPMREGAALDRFITIDLHARYAVKDRLTIEVAALR